jgi:hypothetical protein
VSLAPEPVRPSRGVRPGSRTRRPGTGQGLRHMGAIIAGTLWPGRPPASADTPMAHVPPAVLLLLPGLPRRTLRRPDGTAAVCRPSHHPNGYTGPLLTLGCPVVILRRPLPVSEAPSTQEAS